MKKSPRKEALVRTGGKILVDPSAGWPDATAPNRPAKRGSAPEDAAELGREAGDQRQVARERAAEDEATALGGELGLGGIGHDVPFRRRVVKRGSAITPT